MDNWITRFRNAVPINQDEPVLIPGDPERESEKIRMTEGIPVLRPVIKDLEELAERFGVEF
jgi:LDH2 family malate/lactate/ureidoglycolate dehydrogenase